MSSANEILQAIADFFADVWSRYQLALDTEYGTALATMTVLLAAAVLYLVIILLLLSFGFLIWQLWPVIGDRIQEIINFIKNNI